MATYTSVGATAPYAQPSCCQTRPDSAGNTWLILLGNAARGKIWKALSSGASTVIWDLGITAPTDTPTLTVTADVGQAWKGKYYCAYRFIDANNTPSSLTPLATVSTARHDQFNWTAIGPPAEDTRMTTWELYRSQVNNQDIVFRVGTGSTGTSFPTVTDTYTDTQLAALPALAILNDDGSENARRFDPPPSTAAVVFTLRNRYFYVTSDAIWWSAPNEPESVPATAKLEFMLPTDSPDKFVAAVVGDNAWLFQKRHTWAFSCGQDPRWHASFRPAFARGAVNAQCIARYDDMIYALDESGVWRFGRDGVDPKFGLEIHDYWRDGIAHISTAFVVADPSEQVVRFHCQTTEAGFPAHALVYNVVTKAWTTELYGAGLSAGFTGVVGGKSRAIYSTTGARLLYSSSYLTDLIGIGIPLTATAATSTTLTVAGYDFTSYLHYAGLGVTMTTGNDRGETRRLASVSTAAPTVITLATAAGTTPAAGDKFLFGSTPYTFKSARLSIPMHTPDDPGKAKRFDNVTVDIRYKPTSTDQWVQIKFYWDADTTPIYIAGHRDEDTAIAATTNYGLHINLGGTGNPGYYRFPLNVRSGALEWTHKSVTVEVVGAQGNAEIIIYSIDIEPAK